jgi:RND family efflux transporter MFP subunit
VAVQAATVGPIASHYEATATLESDKQAEILARVSGVIVRILAEEGDRVQEGQELLRIEDDEYVARVKQAEAQAELQRSRFERNQKMFQGDLLSAEEFDAARTDLQAAEASLELAQLELSYTRVTAPFTGILVTRDVDPGQNVNNGTLLFTISDVSRLLAKVHVPAKEFRRIAPGRRVELVLDSSNEHLQGTIDLVSPVIDATTGTIKITVSIPSYPPGTRPGDFAEVRIETERHEDALLVPRGAVVTEQGEPVLFVVAPDSTAERRVVEVGFQDELNAEILSGLNGPETVVVQGQRSLKHGSPLKIMERITFEETAPGES